MFDVTHILNVYAESIHSVHMLSLKWLCISFMNVKRTAKCLHNFAKNKRNLVWLGSHVNTPMYM